ncbi:cyclopropane-fatty-acyl-phospholipid synthase family protein [Marinobacter sp.]|uniref:cyclopropane-fatty-acyl-phospholipid synthase family protein n=1 Tax=Marinobacter sp. TaxID=50741 RepID=UPI002B268E0C|nr:cyclopropane-fatty-acyl-phospholipid synthase family protein [Marinobacter sp.]
MSSRNARKASHSGKDAPHPLSIPYEAPHPDREPHSYERWLLEKFIRLAGSPPIRFQLWNGDQIEPEHQTARFTLTLNDSKALYALVTDPNLAMGDLYSSGRLDIDGDLTNFLETVYHTVHTARQQWPKWLDSFWKSPNPRSSGLSQAKENIHHHYDLGNEFYKLWLDQAEMQYTCAYYEHPDNTLEQAQLAKLEHVCRKLRLKPGMTVVEAGCGWGGLARYMARHYGVTVRSYNISREQLSYAKTETKRQGLDKKISYIEDDYRNIQGEYDAFVSVGMLEHVGKENYPALSDLIKRSLKPNGIALLHSIGRNQPMLMNAWIEKRIFPGAYPPSIAEFMQICEHNDFSVLDVENLRLHYAQTLTHWLKNFTQHQDAVTHMYDQNFTRAWRFYLAGSIAAFRAGSLQLFQVVFSHGDNNLVPRTRQDLYATPTTPEHS